MRDRAQRGRGSRVATARWELPSSSKALMDATKNGLKNSRQGQVGDFRTAADGVRRRHDQHPYVKSKHWTRWLASRTAAWCRSTRLASSTRRKARRLVRARRYPALACFAGIWTNWTSVRKVKEGETTTTSSPSSRGANAEVRDHPKRCRDPDDAGRSRGLDDVLRTRP